MKFALYFANRGNFPGSLMAAARAEVSNALAKLGIESLLLPESATRFGAGTLPAGAGRGPDQLSRLRKKSTFSLLSRRFPRESTGRFLPIRVRN